MCAVRAISLPATPSVGYHTDRSTGKTFYFDGVNWYYINGFMRQRVDMASLIAQGIVIALADDYPNTPPSVTIGDTIAVTVTYSYTGPAVSDVLQWIAVGTGASIGGFDERYQNYAYKKTAVQVIGTMLNDDNTTTPKRALAAATVATPHSFTWTAKIPTGAAADWIAIMVELSGGTPKTVSGSLQFMYGHCLAMLSTDANITSLKISTVSKVTT